VQFQHHLQPQLLLHRQQRNRRQQPRVKPLTLPRQRPLLKQPQQLRQRLPWRRQWRPSLRQPRLRKQFVRNVKHSVLQKISCYEPSRFFYSNRKTKFVLDCCVYVVDPPRLIQYKMLTFSLFFQRRQRLKRHRTETHQGMLVDRGEASPGIFPLVIVWLSDVFFQVAAWSYSTSNNVFKLPFIFSATTVHWLPP